MNIVPGSFRDNRGFVFVRDGVLYRQINQAGASDFDALVDGGLYSELTSERLLIEHQEVGPNLAATTSAYKVVQPETLPFISYPYEWCFSQLKEAALATLEIQKRALAKQMTLRDASAFNIQWRSGRPVLIDTLSFGRFVEGEPWVAYRQFCQHFLAPLALMAYLDVRLSGLLRVHIDGIPLDLAATLLPGAAKLRPSLALHVFSHARSQKKHQSNGNAQKSVRSFSMRAFQGLLDSLEGAVRKLEWNPSKEGWADYYEERESYSAGAMEHKKEIVERLVGAVAPSTIWDLGANTGLFSRVAARVAPEASIVSWELDPSCVEVNHREVRAKGERIVPLLLDLTNPSPGLGWAHEERDSLVARGPADLVIALALIHHLAIANNVPLGKVASFLARLCANLIIEFVPKDDPMVRHLLATREDIFEDYTRERFEEAFSSSFEMETSEEVKDSGRVIYLFRKRS